MQRPPATVLWQVLSLQTNLAVQVSRAVGSPGSAVLIFVPGMATILEVMNLFELISSADVTYKVREELQARSSSSGVSMLGFSVGESRVALRTAVHRGWRLEGIARRGIAGTSQALRL